MSSNAKIHKKQHIKGLAQHLRSDLATQNNQDFILLYAYNGTGKTMLSTEFKDIAKKKGNRDTLYFNAYTEDLFQWDNDLDNDIERFLKINSYSKFFEGFKELALDVRIEKYFNRYADSKFQIDYDNWQIRFSRNLIKKIRKRDPESGIYKTESKEITKDNIKISRGEENIFKWCIFLAICELTIDGDEAYSWVKYIYIDDPISSLDDNNAITVASDLASLLRKSKDAGIKCVISSHHTLFFNVMCNEIKSCKKYFLSYSKKEMKYFLQSTTDTPFFHHVATLHELKKAIKDDKVYTYHFNMLRGILEKTATFFGNENFSSCIHGVEDETLYARALNLLSHGNYSLFEPHLMLPENKALFENIFNAFLERYNFALLEME